MDARQFEEEVKAKMEASRIAYNNGDPGFFKFFAKDATVFSAISSEAIKGREAYQRHFEPKLKGEKREVKILDQNLQLIGERAVIAQTAQIRVGDITSNIRQTIVWANTDEGVVVQHLHTTLIGTPVSDSIPKSAGAIRVLNEKIATIASVLGVAQ